MNKGGAPEQNLNHEVHGAYSYARRGQSALDDTGRTLHAELSELVLTRPGVVELMQRRTVDACLIVSLLQNDVVSKTRAGVEPVNIGSLRMLAVYMNSAQRQLHDLYDVLPDEGRSKVTAAMVLDSIRAIRSDTDEPHTQGAPEGAEAARDDQDDPG